MSKIDLTKAERALVAMCVRMKLRKDMKFAERFGSEFDTGSDLAKRIRLAQSVLIKTTGEK